MNNLPNRLEITPTKTRIVLGNILIYGLLILSIWFLLSAFPFDYGSLQKLLGGIVGIPTSIWLIKNLKPSQLKIILTHNDCRIHYAGGNSITFPWADVENIGMFKVKNAKNVGVKFSNYQNIRSSKLDKKIKNDTENVIDLYTNYFSTQRRNMGGYDINFSAIQLDRSLKKFESLLKDYHSAFGSIQVKEEIQFSSSSTKTPVQNTVSTKSNEGVLTGNEQEAEISTKPRAGLASDSKIKNLREAQQLFEDGVIDEDEFKSLKKGIINENSEADKPNATIHRPTTNLKTTARSQSEDYEDPQFLKDIFQIRRGFIIISIILGFLAIIGFISGINSGISEDILISIGVGLVVGCLIKATYELGNLSRSGLIFARISSIFLLPTIVFTIFGISYLAKLSKPEVKQALSN